MTMKTCLDHQVFEIGPVNTPNYESQNTHVTNGGWTHCSPCIQTRRSIWVPQCYLVKDKYTLHKRDITSTRGDLHNPNWWEWMISLLWFYGRSDYWKCRDIVSIHKYSMRIRAI